MFGRGEGSQGRAACPIPLSAASSSLGGAPPGGAPARLKRAIRMDYTTIKVEMVAREPVELPPFTGSTLRGGLGHALKRGSCARRGECDKTCEVPSQCAYGALFETPIPADAPARIKASATAPHAMILTPSPQHGLLLAGQALTFELTLVSDAVSKLPILIGALEAMAEHGLGRGSLRGDSGSLKLHSVRDALSGLPIYREGGKRDWSAVSVQRLTLEPLPQDERVDQVQVTLQTPTQLRRGQALLRTLDFAELVYACADRLWLMLACHAPELADRVQAADLAGLARSLNIQTTRHDLRTVSFDRWSNRQGSKHPLEGLMGQATYQGPVGNFMPLLRAGQLLHVGKGSAFGLGKLVISATPS